MKQVIISNVCFVGKKFRRIWFHYLISLTYIADAAFLDPLRKLSEVSDKQTSQYDWAMPSTMHEPSIGINTNNSVVRRPNASEKKPLAKPPSNWPIDIILASNGRGVRGFKRLVWTGKYNWIDQLFTHPTTKLQSRSLESFHLDSVLLPVLKAL